MANRFFFFGAKNPSATVVTIAPSAHHCLGRKRHLLVENIYLNIEEPESRRQGPVVRCPPRTLSTTTCAASPSVSVASSASQPVSIASTPTANHEEREKGREQWSLLGDVVLDAFLVDIEWYKKPVPEVSPTVEWFCNCLLSPGV